jgi:hypothetical protein
MRQRRERPSLPLVQDVLVRNRDAGAFQLAEGANDVVVLHVASLRAVAADDENAGVTALGFEDQLV